MLVVCTRKQISEIVRHRLICAPRGIAFAFSTRAKLKLFYQRRIEYRSLMQSGESNNYFFLFRSPRIARRNFNYFLNSAIYLLFELNTGGDSCCNGIRLARLYFGAFCFVPRLCISILFYIYDTLNRRASISARLSLSYMTEIIQVIFYVPLRIASILEVNANLQTNLKSRRRIDKSPRNVLLKKKIKNKKVIIKKKEGEGKGRKNFRNLIYIYTGVPFEESVGAERRRTDRAETSSWSLSRPSRRVIRYCIP
ncbi:hypothetical protein PUN28_011053 [Cardiocondyla obscurior]|uniref:Uncharacterized protein n=1 Tax=Cardiocondyla obscurior TaxID=286306 RepID=A0AAW2FIW8_9HYME